MPTVEDASGRSHDWAAELIQAVVSRQHPEGYWMGTFVTDTSFTADYILLAHYLDAVNEERQRKAFRYILDELQDDGGWSQYPGGQSTTDISVIDYLCISGSLDDRTTEWADHLHEHFLHPATVRNGAYVLPEAPGYSIEMHPESIAALSYPDGVEWR